jgi:SAM-dependent methyltransferase
MIFDIAWKLGRKSLTGGLYDFLSYRVLGRNRRYERLETYESIYRHYRDHGLEFRGRKVAEIGCGLQLFTGLQMLAEGASEVILVEPKLDFSPTFVEGHVLRYNAARDKTLAVDDVAKRSRAYKDLGKVPADDDGSVDIVCSYTVLEHVPDLSAFFRESYRVLKPGGVSYHLVDLSDHTYQVLGHFPLVAGINSRRGLYHLRYGDGAFARLNDPKCWMNRQLLPTYLDLARKVGFAVERLEVQPFRGPVQIHPDLLARVPGTDPAQLRALTFSLMLRK